MESFRRRGFVVGPLVANNFSIEAPVATFEEYFGVRLVARPSSGMQIEGVEGASAFELPRNALPDPVRDKVTAVLFTRPPDFGPGACF
jgi:hypothetical protein